MSQKRLLRVQRIRLDEHAFQIQRTKLLFDHSTLEILTRGVAGLSDRHTQGRGVQRHKGNAR